MILSMAVQSTVQLIRLFQELKIKIRGMNLYCDNHSCIKMLRSQKKTFPMKHIDIRHHFVKNEVQKNKITIQYIRSEDNETDVFTKELRRPILERLI